MRNDLDVPTCMRLQRANGQFMPPGKWHGDKFPRTMEEAFGQGATLHVEGRRHKPAPFKPRGRRERTIGYTVAVVVALWIGFTAWALGQ